MWKKVIESQDLIIYEKSVKNVVIRIEARLQDDGTWEIYKKNLNERNMDHLVGFHSKTREEAYYLVDKLKRMRSASSVKSKSPKKLEIRPKRLIKEINYCIFI